MKLSILQTAATSAALLTSSLIAQTKPILPLLPSKVSTVPARGDVNPYGVAFVPRSVPVGVLQPGDILVSNFNNNQNLQGTGTTIVRMNAMNQASTFFDGATVPAVGLTAAMGVLANGTVLAGNLPTADGTAATVQAGALNFINRNGTFIGALKWCGCRQRSLGNGDSRSE
jgi:hypothetical protein